MSLNYIFINEVRLLIFENNYINSFLKKRLFLDSVIYSYSNNVRYFDILLYSLICFSVPIMFSHPQILVGTVVNAVLILSAHYLKNLELVPAIIFPSLGVVFAGVLFSALTMHVLVLIPFIWVGNFILVYFFKKYRIIDKKKYFLVLCSGAFVKSAFLGVSAGVLILAGVVPKAMLVPFSVLQFMTAFFGGVVAFFIIKARSYLSAM